jgi:hypothetical protein
MYVVASHLQRGQVLVLWKILDGKSASEPEEYCTALKDRTKDNGFIEIDIRPQTFSAGGLRT